MRTTSCHYVEEEICIPVAPPAAACIVRLMTQEIELDELRWRARFFVALLDAIDEANLISGTAAQAQWRTVKARLIEWPDYEAESETLYALLVEIEQANLIRGTWMEHRWRSVVAQMSEGHPA